MRRLEKPSMCMRRLRLTRRPRLRASAAGLLPARSHAPQGAAARAPSHRFGETGRAVARCRHLRPRATPWCGGRACMTGRPGGRSRRGDDALVGGTAAGRPASSPRDARAEGARAPRRLQAERDASGVPWRAERGGGARPAREASPRAPTPGVAGDPEGGAAPGALRAASRLGATGGREPGRQSRDRAWSRGLMDRAVRGVSGETELLRGRHAPQEQRGRGRSAGEGCWAPPVFDMVDTVRRC